MPCHYVGIGQSLIGDLNGALGWMRVGGGGVPWRGEEWMVMVCCGRWCQVVTQISQVVPMTGVRSCCCAIVPAIVTILRKIVAWLAPLANLCSLRTAEVGADIFISY